MSTPIVIDCDPGHDDAIAILLALGSPEVELLGVTTVSGNAPLERTTENALRVLEHVGRGDVPVAAGADRPLVRTPHYPADAHGATGLDGPDLPPPRGSARAVHAVDFLAAALAAPGRAVTLVAVGPLTNVALLLARHPQAAQRIERLVVMGGAIGEGNATPSAEFNVWTDPEAARRAFSSGLDVTMVGLDVTHRALVTPEGRDRLRGVGRAGRLVAELLDFYARWHAQDHGWTGVPVHDALAVAVLVAPQILSLEPCRIDVECGSELCRGRTSVDRSGRGAAPDARVATGIDADAFLDLLAERLAALG